MAIGAVHRCSERIGESKTGISIGTVLRTIKETGWNFLNVRGGTMRPPHNPWMMDDRIFGGFLPLLPYW